MIINKLLMVNFLDSNKSVTQVLPINYIYYENYEKYTLI